MKNEYLDYLFRSLKHHPSPYIIYDLDGSIRWINLAAEYIFRTEDITLTLIFLLCFNNEFIKKLSLFAVALFEGKE